jgi:hypothetical protein
MVGGFMVGCMFVLILAILDVTVLLFCLIPCFLALLNRNIDFVPRPSPCIPKVAFCHETLQMLMLII